MPGFLGPLDDAFMKDEWSTDVLNLLLCPSSLRSSTKSSGWPPSQIPELPFTMGGGDRFTETSTLAAPTFTESLLGAGAPNTIAPDALSWQNVSNQGNYNLKPDEVNSTFVLNFLVSPSDKLCLFERGDHRVVT